MGQSFSRSNNIMSAKCFLGYPTRDHKWFLVLYFQPRSSNWLANFSRLRFKQLSARRCHSSITSRLNNASLVKLFVPLLRQVSKTSERMVSESPATAISKGFLFLASLAGL